MPELRTVRPRVGRALPSHELSRRSLALAFTAVAALLVGCGSPANNSALFSSSSASAAGSSIESSPGGDSSAGGSSNVAGSASAAGSLGDASAGGQGDTNGGSGSAGAGNASSAGSASGGSSAGSSSEGGRDNTGGQPNAGGSNNTGGMSDAGNAGSAGNAGNGGSAGGAPLTDCSAFGSDATFYSETAHCYLVVHDDATFADARMHCASLGAHLVTLRDRLENDFVWSLDATEHWIGATDGRGPKEMLSGTYAWVDGEPFTYTDWSTNQPNASASSCGDTNGGGTCYEHCAFQWSGGNNPGEWNDRLCAHTIESVCEWDSAK